ncbi:hypothetical protein PoB_002879800 [Plakobranchus ocellatus]|uniref:Uncharacterized protein n=1 Tax=Plakobranchus ocellatus TaxID=259542 RepID=A0AAV4A6M2_9GAST|nr:hypothetical protein PoB_002879800 [Plakobranchus ocellatus]
MSNNCVSFERKAATRITTTASGCLNSQSNICRGFESRHRRFEVLNKVISSFQTLRQARAPVEGPRQKGHCRSQGRYSIHYATSATLIRYRSVYFSIVAETERGKEIEIAKDGWPSWRDIYLLSINNPSTTR